ncbi:MAG: redoxin domain-containing protein [Vicingaceae bacterium]
MKQLLHLSRIVVGNLFIFSGIVKANDPLGFSYKLEEYFIEFGMNWHWLEEILVPLAAGLCILEIILGVAVLLGYKMKEVSWVLLLMIIFFTILTGASAIFEIVRSCGCFGDAIPLTPWQSFYKDLILLAFILLLFFKRKEIKPFEKPKAEIVYFLISSAIMLALSFMLAWNAPFIFTLLVLGIALGSKLIAKAHSAAIGVLVSLVGSIWFSVYAIEHLPFKDFRPYAVGKSIPEQMVLPEGAQPPVYENILVYKNTKTGEEKEFTSEEYTAAKIWENKDWEWVSTESTMIKEGDTPKITDLSITNAEGEDYTDYFLDKEKVLFIISYDLSKSNTESLPEIKELVTEAKKKGIEVIGLSAAGAEEKNSYAKQHDLNFDFWITDGIVLKTIVRSNPGLVYLEKGTVKGKWHENDVPKIDQL